MQRVILTRKLTPEKLILYPFFLLSPLPAFGINFSYNSAFHLGIGENLSNVFSSFLLLPLKLQG